MFELRYQSDVVRIWINKSKRLGKAEWRGFLTSEQFRENGLRCVKLCEEEKLECWLADQRTMRAIRQQDLQWAALELLPIMLATPLRRMAIIVSVDIFNNMAMEQLYKRAGSLGNLVIKEFEKEDEALAWLQKPFDVNHESQSFTTHQKDA